MQVSQSSDLLFYISLKMVSEMVTHFFGILAVLDNKDTFVVIKFLQSNVLVVRFFESKNFTKTAWLFCGSNVPHSYINACAVCNVPGHAQWTRLVVLH